MKNLDNPEIKRGDKNSIFPLGDYILNQLWNIIQFYTNFLENNSLNTKTCNVPPPERHRFPKGLSYDSQQQEIEDKYRLEKSILRTLHFGEALLTSKSVVQFIGNLLIPSYLGAGIKVILETQPERENSELFGLHKNAPQKQDLFIYKENYLPLTNYAIDFYMSEAGKSQPYKWIEYISKLDKSAISPKEIMLGLDIINEKILNEEKLSKEEEISYAFWNYRDNFSIYSAIYNKIKEQYEQIMVPADIPFFTRGIEKGKEIEELFGIKDRDLQKLFTKDPTLGGTFDWRKVLFGSGQSGNKSNKGYELDINPLNMENKSFVIDYSSDWLQSLNNYASNSESELTKLSSSGQIENGFTLGEGISIPLRYEIEVKGLEQFESVKENAEEAGEAVEESRGTISNFSAEMMRQFLNLKEEQRAALSVDMAMLPLNVMRIGGAPASLVFRDCSTVRCV